MKILVITSLYHIVGRQELFHDTSVVHYFLKPLAKENDILVVNVYFERIRRFWRYLRKEDRGNRNGYEYTTDGINVGLIEVIKPIGQKSRLGRKDTRRVVNYIEKFTLKNNFRPDVIISHFPITTINAVSEVFPDVPKVAILHGADMDHWFRNEDETATLRSVFSRYYARSEALRNFFSDQGLERLDDEIVYSGGKKYEGKTQRVNDGSVKTMFVGKLDQNKRLDLVIDALHNLKDSYYFILEVYGDGKEKKKLEQYAKEKLGEGRCRFFGKVNHDVVLEAMSRNDYFIMISERETFGLVYVEAIVNGCIPIGTAGEGIDGIIIDGYNGFLVKPNDVNELTKCLKRCFLMDSNEHARILSNLAESAKTLNELSAARHYLELVQRVIDPK